MFDVGHNHAAMQRSWQLIKRDNTVPVIIVKPEKITQEWLSWIDQSFDHIYVIGCDGFVDPRNLNKRSENARLRN